MIVTEILKQLFFYRTSNQLEIDLLIEHGDQLVPIVFKFAKSIKRSMAQPMDRFVKEYEVETGYLVSLYEKEIPLFDKVTALPWSRIVSNLDTLMNQP